LCFLPPSLQTLKLYYCPRRTMHCWHTLENLKYLSVFHSNHPYHQMHRLPPSLRYFKIEFNNPGMFTMEHFFHYTLPNTLTVLCSDGIEVIWDTLRNDPNSLNSLHTFIMGELFYHILEELPDCIETLVFNLHLKSQNITRLPNNLKRIILPSKRDVIIPYESTLLTFLETDEQYKSRDINIEYSDVLF
jgi:hypothetical protein